VDKIVSNDEKYWISQIDKSEGLSVTEKESSKHALKELEKILGSDIASVVVQKHPISRYVFVNSAPWTYKWLISFVESVQLVSSQTNGINIINKLKNPSEFNDALFQIYISTYFIGAGLEIEFLQEDNKNKIADWKVTDTDNKEKLLVELTELSLESSEEKDIHWTFDRVYERIFKNSRPDRIPKLFYRGRLFKPYISRPVLEELFKKIDCTANDASNNGFAELIEYNTISLAFATDDKKYLLKPWAIEKNIVEQIEADRDPSDSSFKGVPYQINEIERIKSSIKKKKRQFDRNALNALVIRANRLFLPSYIEKHIDTLKQLVYDREYLAILIIVGGHVGGLEINSTIESDGHLYLIRSIDLITKEILILTNKYSRDLIKTLQFSAKIKNAFENCNTMLF
jgi:hypothetical protein